MCFDITKEQARRLCKGWLALQWLARHKLIDNVMLRHAMLRSRLLHFRGKAYSMRPSASSHTTGPEEMPSIRRSFSSSSDEPAERPPKELDSSWSEELEERSYSSSLSDNALGCSCSWSDPRTSPPTGSHMRKKRKRGPKGVPPETAQKIDFLHKNCQEKS